jgi:hypothetical protein
MIRFDCPFCEQRYKVSEDFAGRSILCKNPKCQQQMQIPDVAEVEIGDQSEDWQDDKPRRKRRNLSEESRRIATPLWVMVGLVAFVILVCFGCCGLWAVDSAIEIDKHERNQRFR